MFLFGKAQERYGVPYSTFILSFQPLLIYLQLYTQLPLEAKYKKALECEFHSADYHMLTEITSGLRNATEHLVKVQHIKLLNIFYCL